MAVLVDLAVVVDMAPLVGSAARGRTVALAVLALVRIAPLAVSGAGAVEATALCPMSAPGRGSTSRRPLTNMLVQEEILMS